MHGDELYDRAQFPSEVHYFHCPAEVVACSVTLPPGKTTIQVQSGFRRKHVSIERDLPAGQVTKLPVPLPDNDLPPEFGKFLSADLHVHMNYGGHYRNTPERLLAQQDAEDLDVVYNLLVNKEERITDIAYFQPGGHPDSASGKRMLFHAQEYHTSFWGHMGLLNLESHYLLPDYTAYRHTPYESPWPNNGAIADLAHAQNALVGYVHIADFPIDPPNEKKLSYELPATVAHGKVDYLEVMGFSDHHITAGIWYRLLNLGFRLPAGAGTDAMANYASLRGPIGLVRVFLDTEGERTPTALRNALKSGRTFVSNSALLGLTVGGQRPGGVLERGGRLPVRVALRAPIAMDHLELVQNGRVIKSFTLDRRAHALRLGRRYRFRRRRLGRAARLQRRAASLGARSLPLRDDEPGLFRRRRHRPPRKTPRTSSPGWTASSRPPTPAAAGTASRKSPTRSRTSKRHARSSARSPRPEGARPTMIRPRALAGLVAGATLTLALAAGATEPAKFSLEDFTRLAGVSDLDLAPDGEWVVYSVTEANLEDDAAQTDLWRAGWDGTGRRALTRTPDSDESGPRVSPDGKWIAFLSDRGDEDAKTQVWVMHAEAGEAEKLTDFPGGVSEFDWSPDSARLAVIADDPERPAGEEAPKQPPPIELNRYYFKEDYHGWVTDRRQHLYLFDVAARKATQLTSGAHDEFMPAFSPDGGASPTSPSAARTRTATSTGTCT